MNPYPYAEIVVFSYKADGYHRTCTLLLYDKGRIRPAWKTKHKHKIFGEWRCDASA